VFIDADCTLEPGALDHLAAAVLRSDRPAQAEYLMRAAPGSALPRRVAEFTWRLRNSVRPSGGFHLGQPCQLMGTGMAFTWAMLEAAPVGTGSIVEDMALGIDLALQGHAPLFCPEARVLSNFPDAAAAQATQQTRWIHGHLILLAQGCPRLIAAAWRRRDARLLGMALDLAVPPLSLLVVSLFAVGLLNLALYAALHLGGVPWAEVGAGTGSFGMIRTAWAALAVALALAWWSDGRDLITGWELLKLPLMLPAKLKILLRFVTRRQAAWVRTDRDPP
jgi:cellulose synthase/poly-beta-1,6-N-acetylglucosamine synthase-like glycosyltransferase